MVKQKYKFSKKEMWNGRKVSRKELSSVLLSMTPESSTSWPETPEKWKDNGVCAEIGAEVIRKVREERERGRERKGMGRERSTDGISWWERLARVSNLLCRRMSVTVTVWCIRLQTLKSVYNCVKRMAECEQFSWRKLAEKHVVWPERVSVVTEDKDVV